MLAVCRPEGSGSSPVDIGRKENLFKVWNMKKQGKIRRAWSAELDRDRPLEVVANTNPTLAPTGESPVAQNTRDWWNRQTPGT